MINDHKVLGHPDATQLTPETELDYRGSEHLVPAPVYYGRKKETEFARQAVQEAFGEYATRGIRELEEYIGGASTQETQDFIIRNYADRGEGVTLVEGQIQYVASASQNISGVDGARQYEIDTHWSLEESRESKFVETMNKAVKGVVTLLIGEKPAKSVFTMPKRRHQTGVTERELIQKESEVGSKLFGPISEDQRREFFNLDPKTWIWYEEVKTPDSKMEITTTRYEVQEKGILKAQDGANYSYLEGDELQNFTLAVQMYYEQVLQKIYHRDPQTGAKLV